MVGCVENFGRLLGKLDLVIEAQASKHNCFLYQIPETHPNRHVTRYFPLISSFLNAFIFFYLLIRNTESKKHKLCTQFLLYFACDKGNEHVCMICMILKQRVCDLVIMAGT